MYLMGLSQYLFWRKGWDSNPRTGSSPITRFRVERVTASSLPFHNGVLYTKSGLRASLFSTQATEEEGRKTALQKNPTSSGKKVKIRSIFHHMFRKPDAGPIRRVPDE